MPVPESVRDALPLWGGACRLKVGLLGGSFNPVHAGHVLIAEEALRVLGLDEVWFLIAPQNPLKKASDLEPFARRLEGVRALLPDKRMRASDLEKRLGTRFTYRTLRVMTARFPNVRFIWLMGADGLANFTRWRHWRDMASLVPMAVFARPGRDKAALASPAATALRRHKITPDAMRGFLADERERVGMSMPWTFVPDTHCPLSSTEVRRGTRS